MLAEDHEKVRRLFEDFESAKESGDTEHMGKVVSRIIDELKVHTRIEEEVFYPAVREAGGDDLERIVLEGIEEHHVVDVLIGEIESLDPGDAEFAPKVTVLVENVEHHAGEEEDEMFPKVREVLDSSALDDLGRRLEEAKRRQP